jgi:nitroimidazol reductase NimA-like FMN-containing flavoprotein (pyridoxamine 5'-phosphate oxidase superfamily)
MFRDMRRKKQALSKEDCARILREERRGALSVIGDMGYPYAVPMNFYYDEAEETIYFHCAREGHKIDALKACPKVCYTVFDKGYRREGEWSLNVRSAVVFGRIEPVTDEALAKKICTALCRKFTDDEDYLRRELTQALPRVQCLALTPEHMTGKLVNES